MGHASLDGGKSVFNFGSQQVAVLKAEGFGFTFEMNVDPAPAFEGIGALEAGILRGGTLAGSSKGALHLTFCGFRAVGGSAPSGPQEPNADNEDQDGNDFANGIGHDGEAP